MLEVTAAVQSVWPTDYPLFVRLSATDWTDGGWSLEETVELSRILHEKGVDLIDCSSGGNVAAAKIPIGPGYQVHFSEAIKKTGIPTAAVGLITSSEQIKDILESGKADLVLLARELLRNPYFALTATLKTEEEISWPTQYLRAK